jgi:hypothetical protein
MEGTGGISLREEAMEKRGNGKVKNEILLYLWSVCIAMGSLTMGYLFVIVSILSSTLSYQASIEGSG